MGFLDMFKRSTPKAPATPTAPVPPAVPATPTTPVTSATSAAQAPVQAAAEAVQAPAAAAAVASTAAAASEAAAAAAPTEEMVQSVVAEEIAGQAEGLPGILDKFRAGGLGDLVDSWVGTGENKGISADQIKSVLSPERLKSIAVKLGISPDMAADKLAAILPTVIDKLTPDGIVPDPEALSAKLTGFIKDKI